ncbi:hypothetical protein HMPREF0322_00901 [Desulfitobacterium hafniense DP7]|uniref:Uncharacterized protein n=1 Tax=Desulfitobacterium hafniense DP7 TaxID=537010 RepID=G9XIX5_DESHA|nr:hypothetical protein HMPREF0322_00901 [Desulfitobacterium hafniense DP7]
MTLGIICYSTGFQNSCCALFLLQVLVHFDGSDISFQELKP